MRYEIQRGICDLLRVELEAGEAVVAKIGKFIFARGAVEWDVTLSVTVFVHAAGDFVSVELARGEVLHADTDSLVWFDASVDFSATRAGGLRRAFLGGEGLFLSSYGWPGRVTLQTLSHAPKPGAGTKEKR